MRFLRSRLSKVLFAGGSIPILGLGGLSAYVQYRQSTRPTRHIFHPVVDDHGNLLLDGKVVERPGIASLCWRAFRLFFLFAPLALLYIFMRLRADWYQVWLNMLLAAVQRAGPAFVKAGQWSCTREDIFSPEFRKTFKRLYREVDVHPYADTLRILEEELGADPLTIFGTIEEGTVGSGSIGQVHLATLKDSNRNVVIKVMHPNIIQIIVKDFTIINSAAKWVDWCFPSLERFHLPELALAWTNHLAAQLDFRIEAENLKQFRHNFQRVHYVEFPDPLRASQRMLVETFCEGEPANPEFLATLPYHAREALASKGLNTWCQMLLRDNFIHGDMHPGNILIDCTDLHNPTITLIDVGLCQQLTEEEGDVTFDMMASFVRWNPTLCADSLWRMSSSQQYCNREKFERELQDIFRRFRPARNDDMAVTNILQTVFSCIRENRVQMDPPYVSLLFAVLVLESFIMNLDPNFNLVQHCAPWLVSEGHLSKGIVQNLCKSNWNDVKRNFNIFTGHVRDKFVSQESAAA